MNEQGGRGPAPIGDLLDALRRDLRLEERHREGALAAAWDAAVLRVAGAAAVSRLRPTALRAGVLTVEVEGAPLLHQVRGFWAGQLKVHLAETPAGARIRDIRYVPAPKADATTTKRLDKTERKDGRR